MKLNFKSFAMGVIITAMLFSAVMVIANPQTVTREITYGVGVRLDGQSINFDEDSRPFLMEGRTFLPVRAIADAVGLDVAFDAVSNTVLLVSASGADELAQQPTPEPTPQGMAFIDAAPWFEVSSNGPQIINRINMRNETFTNAYVSRQRNNLQWSNHDLGGRFNTFTATIGRVDGSGEIARHIVFIGDGRELASFHVTSTTAPHEISVNVTGVDILRIEFTTTAGASNNQVVRIAVADGMLQ